MKKTLLILLIVLCVIFCLSSCKKKKAAEDTPKDNLSTSEVSSSQDADILFIEAEDPLHNEFGSFKVGDKFTTYQKDENGTEVGVTVWVHKNDKEKPYVAYFTNAKEMQSLKVDISDCKLDDNGCFTEPGVFSVKLEYSGFETSYDIRVESEKKE